ncbi:MAG: hypothetical protein ACK5LM_03010, partial [Lactovum sp.]
MSDIQKKLESEITDSREKIESTVLVSDLTPVSDSASEVSAPVSNSASEVSAPVSNSVSESTVTVVNSDVKLEKKKKTVFWWGVLGFFLPLVGLILFIIWRKDTQTKGKGKASG